MDMPGFDVTFGDPDTVVPDCARRVERTKRGKETVNFQFSVAFQSPNGATNNAEDFPARLQAGIRLVLSSYCSNSGCLRSVIFFLFLERLCDN